jgi:predicted ribosome quality control (RQC) complex YloA/Tae2 family protein
MDQFLLQAVTAEAAARLVEHELLRVAHLGHSRYLLRFATPRKDNLLVSLRPDLPRLHLTPRDARFLELPPDRFAAWLDGDLGGARLAGVETLPWDRVVTLRFRLPGGAADEAGRLVVIELLGRSANLLTLDAAGRITAFARPLKSAFRAPRAGAPYQPPPGREPYAGLAPGPESLITIRRRFDDEAAFLRPLSPLLAEDLRAAAARGDKAAEGRLEAILAAAATGRWQPTVYSVRPLEEMSPGDRIGASDIVVSPLPLLAPGGAAPARSIRAFESPSEAAHAAFDLRERLADFLALREHHLSLCRRERDRLRVLIGRLEADLEGARGADRHRRHGEALLAGLAAARVEGETAIVPDPADQEGPALRIPIDPRRTLQGNADRCFERVRKAKRAIVTIGERLLAARTQAAAWERLTGEADAVGGGDDLERLREAMAGLGLVHAARGRPKTPPGTDEPEPARVRRHLSPDGLTILVGRSGAENDTLTFKVAAGWDFWLHAAGTRGAHVVVRNPQRLGSLPEATLRRAAEIAAFYSGARADGAVEVHYTQRKHVHKRRGALPGQVVVRRFRTVRVTPRLPAPSHRDV